MGDIAIAIKDYYAGVIRQIMREHNIAVANYRQEPSISATANFETVVQYTDWYVAGMGSDRLNTRPYRYRRYLEALQSVITIIPQRVRLAHVDIGCGSGLFSWAFLDRIQELQVGYENVDLYGYDHCHEMINLAEMIRTGLERHIPNYPELRYYHDSRRLLEIITAQHRGNTFYFITFGYVLAGNHTDDAISSYVKIVSRVIESIAPKQCVMMASDGVSTVNHQRFVEGWDKLLQALRRIGIADKPWPLNIEGSSDKAVLLSRQKV